MKTSRDFVADPNAAQTIVVDDVRTDPRTSAPAFLAKFDRISIGAFIYVPLVKAGRLVAASLSVHMPSPRAWKQDEISLAQEVAERTWEAVQRACAEEDSARKRRVAAVLAAKRRRRAPGNGISWRGA